MSQHSAKDRAFAKIVDEEKQKCRAARGTCWICHLWIDCSLSKEHKKSFTLDHVESASTPGIDKHRRSNLKWAHRDCNSRRGDGTNRKLLQTTRRW